MVPQCQEHHCQLIPELQVRNKDQINLKGLPEVRFSISFSSLEAAVSASSKISFMLWEQNIPNPSEFHVMARAALLLEDGQCQGGSVFQGYSTGNQLDLWALLLLFQ